MPETIQPCPFGTPWCPEIIPRPPENLCQNVRRVCALCWADDERRIRELVSQECLAASPQEPVAA